MRPGHPAEHNIIQRPELARVLAQAIGARQSHVAPTVQEGIQPVIVLEDYSSTQYREKFRHAGGGPQSVSASPAQSPNTIVGLTNPLGSSVDLIVTAWEFTSHDPAGVEDQFWRTGWIAKPFGDFLLGAGVLTVGAVTFYDTDNFSGSDLPVGQIFRGKCDEGIQRVLSTNSVLAGVGPFVRHVVNCGPGVRLHPGHSMATQLSSPVVGVTVFSSQLQWRELPLKPLE